MNDPRPSAPSTLDGHVRPDVAVGASAYLVLFEGDSTRMVPLPVDGQLVIGRGEGCDLALEGTRVSRTHVRLDLVGGQAQLTDLNSQNGTLLNDELVSGQRPLVSGDVIVVGETVLVFHTSARLPRTRGMLDPGAFRARAEVEIERAVRFSRPLAMVDLAFSRSPERALLQPVLDSTLRHIDLCAFVATDHLAVIFPEAGADEARELAAQLVEAASEVCPARAGLAVCADDGADAETLIAAARAASSAAAPGAVMLASATYTTLTFGEKTVLVADASMVRVYDLVQRLAKSDLGVLIQGESGTGKELVATALHHCSPRAARPLLAVNCAALQETLLESELFGHERGAFTGAVAARQGLFEAVAGGTLFLDEVTEMSAALQAKLLRALETRRITRLGDTREREVDFRVVTASHRDLSAEVKAGRFRQDLFFRLVGAAVWVPPLRDRKRELPLLARRFLEQACAKAGQPAPLLAPETLRLLGEHPWPGNVRELRNAMEFAAATVSDGTVEPWHLRSRTGEASAAPAGVTAAPGAAAPQFRPIADELRELERRRMIEALDACDWNQTRAAAALSMPLRTFVTRFRQYELGRDR